jgi:hypothetical protein
MLSAIALLYAGIGPASRHVASRCLHDAALIALVRTANSPVTVMPSCAPDSMNEVRRVTRCAAPSPAAARAFSVDRSTTM